jgi:hypothetical protein
LVVLTIPISVAIIIASLVASATAVWVSRHV